MAIEPPLKKRKHYEGESSGHVQDAENVPTNVKAERAHGGSMSEEQKLRKKANRDEIGAFYKLYRRLKFCLNRKGSAGSTSVPDFEETYCSILNLSTGCSSVQRIAAQLIPRYAVYCPSAIDLASNVLIQILEWSEDVIFQEEDYDGVAFDTANSCLLGMVELSAAAMNAADEVPEISDMSMAVCQNIAFYMLCRVEGHDLPSFSQDAYESKVSECIKSSTSVQGKLLDLVTINLVRLFYTHPKSVFAACFDLLGATTENQRSIGQQFLVQIMSKGLSQDKDQLPVVISPDSHKDGLKDDCSQCQPEPPIEHKMSAMSLIEQVLYGKVDLERWLVSAYRKFCNSVCPEVLAESCNLLTELLQSMSTFKESDLDPSYVEPPRSPENETVLEDKNDLAVESQIDKGSPKSTASGLASVPANELSVSPSSCNEDRPQKMVDSEDTNDSGQKEVPLDTDAMADRGVPDVDIGSSKPMKQGLANSISSISRTSTIRSKDTEDHDQIEDFDGGIRTEIVPSSSIELHNDQSTSGPGFLLSPKGFSISRPQDLSPVQPRATWYSDGDPAALDIFAASKQLWVGSLGHGVNENLMRLEFEKFGPINSLSLFPGQDFGLVEYKSLNDAVRAREVLQGAAPWSAPLKIKFLDVGLGSRGTVGGVAVGDSCHVYIGGVNSLAVKEEVLQEISHAWPPRSVCVLASAGALLLEFAAPQEAAAAMSRVRQWRRESGFMSIQSRHSERASDAHLSEGGSSGGHLWVSHIDPLVSDQELITAFLEYGELIGWKFFRQSASCIVEFRSPQAAARAKVELHGARFGGQCIQVEHRNIQKGVVGSFSGSANFFSSGSVGNLWSQPSIPGGSNPSRSLQSPRESSQLAFRGNLSLTRGGRDSERLPTNTLWVGFPDHCVKIIPSDTELRTIFNLACKGYGIVTKMSSVRSSRGPCRFVEFDKIEAAATALQNCAGYLDPGVQIEFSNPSNSIQHIEYPHTIVTPLNEEWRMLWEKDHKWDGGLHTSSSMGDHDDVKSNLLHKKSSLQTGWGQSHYGSIVDQSKFRYERTGPGQFESLVELKDDVFKSDPSSGKYSTPANFRTTPGFTGTSFFDNHGSSHGSSHSWHNTSRAPDRHLSDSSASQHSFLTPPPALKHTPHVHLDRLSSTSSWSAQSLISSSIDPAVNVSSAVNTVPILQSPVTPMLPRFSTNITFPFDPLKPPHPSVPSISPPPPLPLEAPPPPPPLSPPPPGFNVQSAAPLPHSPPPPLPLEVVKAEGLSSTKQHHWRGSLCKSGYQYCEILAYPQKSGMCHSDLFLEPTEWPSKLDVTKRADFRSVKHSFQNTSRDKRQVCKLCMSQGTSNVQGFQQFVSYLRQRDRAGVVMIPQSGKIWARILFILPWSREICDLLMIHQQSSDGLIGLVLPMDTSFS